MNMLAGKNQHTLIKSIGEKSAVRPSGAAWRDVNV